MPELREQLQELLGDTYTLERELGAGMSRVFVAEETALARKVVIKVLPPETAASVNVARFRREIQLAASLQHPHIVPLLTAGAKGDLLYYVMPLIEGESLRSRLLKRGEFPVNDVVWILRDAASALAYAHEHGVVHRDIKPDNILLTGKFAVVTDFGVAKALSESTSDSNVTSAGVALGTPTYMAPEQAAADPNTDHRADIYALGVVGYELLTGTPPFTGTSPQMILASHVTRAPDPVTQHRSSVPPALANVVMRCLEKKPGDRWQSAEDLTQALAAIASGAITPTVTTPYATPAPAKSSKRTALAAAFILGLAAFAGVAWYAGRGSAPVYDDHRIIVQDFGNETRDASLDPVGKLASDMIRQGITQNSVGEVVEQTAPTDSARPGLIVRGKYYRIGDSLRVQAEIVDARTSQVIRTMNPAMTLASNPSAALDKLGPRVLGAIASLNDPLIAEWARKATEPPVYEAYRAFRNGLDADVPRAGATAGVTSNANDDYVKAVQADSLFVLPWFELYDNAKQLYERRDRLNSLDRAIALSIYSDRQSDMPNAYKYIKQAADAAPAPYLLIQLAQLAIYVSHPHEAVAAMQKADPDGRLKFGWGMRTDALHLAQMYKEELAAVKREHELGLATDYEDAQVYPALGMVKEMNALIGLRMRMPSMAENTPAALMVFAAREFRAHGYLDASTDFANRAVAWYDSRPPTELNEPRYVNVISALYQGGRYAEARDRVEAFARAFPDTRNDAEYFGMLGRIAAATGDTVAARRYMEQLRLRDVRLDPTVRGSGSAFQRALIAAGLGDRALAVTLLEQAFADGAFYEPYLHREIEFQKIQDYPPMKELLWPKE